MKDRKLPGMIFIVLSFIPWITYWTLCGTNRVLAVILPLAMTLILIIPQVPQKEFNIMDIVSLLYFAAASIFTFAFNLSVFIEKSGFLGYSTLCLMALFSIIIGRPYTLQVSKRDYPEVYWKDKSFLNINRTITWVWTVIFMANAVIFLVFSIPFTIILSNILIALGIVFSAIFPSRSLARSVHEKFKKYDWSVNVDLRREKREGEYDVIVVGSGIGGLTCGALLSKRGYRVLVLEQHYQVGGYCSSFERKGFKFNTGVENISGLWEGGSVAYLLRELDLKRDKLFVRNSMKYIILPP